MGILRKVVVGSLAFGAARMAMKSKSAQRTSRSIARTIRRAAASSTRRPVTKRTRSRAHSRA